ncbi:MAG: DoxX family protein [Planctomycetota bacterium]
MRRSSGVTFLAPDGVESRCGLLGAVTSEVVFADLVILGLATRVAVIPLVFTMGVAAFVVHGDGPWFLPAEGAREPALLDLGAYAVLLFTGAGRYSLDCMLGGRPPVAERSRAEPSRSVVRLWDANRDTHSASTPRWVSILWRLEREATRTPNRHPRTRGHPLVPATKRWVSNVRKPKLLCTGPSSVRPLRGRIARACLSVVMRARDE